MDISIFVSMFLVFLLLSLGAQAEPANSGVPSKSHLRADNYRETRLCVQVPVPKPYSCEKEEEVERAYACDTRVEREICEYVEQRTGEECSRLKSEIVSYPCYTLKKDKTCWKIPQQKTKKCRKVVKKQTEIESERTVRREICSQKSYEIKSTCFREEKQTMAYMCYKPQQRTCKNEKVSKKVACNKTKIEKQAYSCDKKTMETVCTERRHRNNNENNHNRFYNHQPVQTCHQQEVTQRSTCYKNVQVEVEERCETTQLKTTCNSPEPKPDTCEKDLPTLKSYECISVRHREVCEMGEVQEKTIDYIDKEEEEEYDCPFVEDVEKCVTYETVVPDICQKEIQKVDKYPCPKPMHKEICHTKEMISPHTCYSIKKVKKRYTCYDVEYKLQCYNQSD